MKLETKTVIKSILKADSTVSSKQRRDALFALDNTTPVSTDSSSHPLLLKQFDVAKLMSCSRQTVKKLTNEGVLQPIKLRSGKGKIRSGDLLRYPYVAVQNLIKEKAQEGE